MNVSSTNVPSTDDDFQNEIESNVTCFHGSRKCSQVTVNGLSSPASPDNREFADEYNEPIDPRVQVRIYEAIKLSGNKILNLD